MGAFIKKVFYALVLGLAIIAIAGLIYLIIPKYQIQAVRLEDDTVTVIKVNTITGQVSTSQKSEVWKIFDEHGRLKFTD
ncbi:hypothetical protein ES705_05385 [subsurface metagenome]